MEHGLGKNRGPKKTKTLELNGENLTLEMLEAVCFDYATVKLSEKSKETIQKSRKWVEKAANSTDKHYSINTGFGFLSRVSIDKKDLKKLQTHLIRSHCTGVGAPHPEEEVRALMLLRANVLARGYSGVRVELVELCLEMLNRGVHPVIPKKGSVGASGDLAPLAHLASVFMGEGEAYYQGQKFPGGKALEKAGLKPISLEAKEGLSLINGTQQMTGMGALTLLRAERLLNLANLIGATSLEGLLGTPRAFEPWIHEMRPHDGQRKSAAMLEKFMEDSEIRDSHETCNRVQDPYSFRCMPQVHGAIGDLFSFVRRTLTTEINSVTDNPLVDPELGSIVSGGNFHGQPIAFALDILAMGLAELANISERRIAKLLDPNFTELPAFLIANEGVNSGLMIAQVTAASLVSENKVLCHPASVDSIPTSNEKEDHVSMGPIAARKAQQVLENTEYVLAIEAMTACQALEFRKPLKPAMGPRKLYEWVRQGVAPLVEDRVLSSDFEYIKNQIASNAFYERGVQEHLW